MRLDFDRLRLVAGKNAVWSLFRVQTAFCTDAFKVWPNARAFSWNTMSGQRSCVSRVAVEAGRRVAARVDGEVTVAFQIPPVFSCRRTMQRADQMDALSNTASTRRIRWPAAGGWCSSLQVACWLGRWDSRRSSVAGCLRLLCRNWSASLFAVVDFQQVLMRSAAGRLDALSKGMLVRLIRWPSVRCRLRFGCCRSRLGMPMLSPRDLFEHLLAVVCVIKGYHAGGGAISPVDAQSVSPSSCRARICRADAQSDAVAVFPDPYWLGLKINPESQPRPVRPYARSRRAVSARAPSQSMNWGIFWIPKLLIAEPKNTGVSSPAKIVELNSFDAACAIRFRRATLLDFQRKRCSNSGLSIQLMMSNSCSRRSPPASRDKISSFRMVCAFEVCHTNRRSPGNGRAAGLRMFSTSSKVQRVARTSRSYFVHKRVSIGVSAPGGRRLGAWWFALPHLFAASIYINALSAAVKGDCT